MIDNFVLKSGRTYSIVRDNEPEIFWETTSNNVKLRFGIRLNDTSIGPFSLELTYNDIESKINPILREVGLLGNSSPELTRTLDVFSFENLIKERIESVNKNFTDEESLKDLITDLDMMVEEMIIPLIPTWCKNEFLKNTFDSVPKEKLEITFGIGSIFKKVLVLKTLDEIEYSSFLNWMVKGFIDTPPSSDDIIWTQYKNAAIKVQNEMR
ncbi:MAG: hypothetical protein MK105_12340 [Crocinitomicaceae bacterium]|nr:hypothetical protein [Crocinitomicaceae bacterium]